MTTKPKVCNVFIILYTLLYLLFYIQGDAHWMKKSQDHNQELNRKWNTVLLVYWFTVLILGNYNNYSLLLEHSESSASKLLFNWSKAKRTLCCTFPQIASLLCFHLKVQWWYTIFLVFFCILDFHISIPSINLNRWSMQPTMHCNNTKRIIGQIDYFSHKFKKRIGQYMVQF